MKGPRTPQAITRRQTSNSSENPGAPQDVSGSATGEASVGAQQDPYESQQNRVDADLDIRTGKLRIRASSQNKKSSGWSVRARAAVAIAIVATAAGIAAIAKFGYRREAPGSPPRASAPMPNYITTRENDSLILEVDVPAGDDPNVYASTIQATWLEPEVVGKLEELWRDEHHGTLSNDDRARIIAGRRREVIPTPSGYRLRYIFTLSNP